MILAPVDASGGQSSRADRSRDSSSRSLGRQAGRFAVIGSTGTGAGLALYSLLGLWMDPLAANGVAWLVTSLATNGFQRHFAFGVTGQTQAPIDHLVALISSLISLMACSAALAPLVNGSSAQQMTALIAVNSLVGAGRFLAVRSWFGRSSRSERGPVRGWAEPIAAQQAAPGCQT